MKPHYELSGPEDAPVVVLGNSLGTTTALWDRQLPVLHRRFRVLRYDHRGHGGSAPAPPGTNQLLHDEVALGLPQRHDVPFAVDESSIVEHYAR